MPKGQKKHMVKEQSKTKHEAPRSVTYRATQNKNNIGTTALERTVVYTTEGFKESIAASRSKDNQGIVCLFCFFKRTTFFRQVSV